MCGGKNKRAGGAGERYDAEIGNRKRGGGRCVPVGWVTEDYLGVEPGRVSVAAAYLSLLHRYICCGWFECSARALGKTSRSIYLPPAANLRLSLRRIQE